MLLKVLATIRKYRLITPGEHIIVAVSGGADSIALLSALHELRPRWNLTLTAVHLDHGIRGAAARQEALLVRNEAQRLGVDCLVGARDVPGYAAAHGLSLQEAAREVRYTFFGEMRAQTGAHKVALGHHADDQAETVLLWLLRGAALAGLGGMAPCRDGVYIRPLIEVSRQQIEQYLRARHIAFVPDTSGSEMQYLRNRVRHRLVPLLRREFNPQISRALARMADLVRQDEAGLSEQVEDALNKHLLTAEDGFVCPVAVFQQRKGVLQRRLMHAAIARLRGSRRGLGMVHIEMACRLLDGQGSSRRLVLPGGCSVRREYGNVIFSRAGQPAQPFCYCFDELPGRVMIAELGRQLVLQRERADVGARAPQGAGPDQVCLDYAKVALPLVIRNWRAGDRFCPLGLGGSKKLHNFFIDQKIPARRRSLIPIMLCGDRIAWVCGLRLDERFKTTAETRQVLRVALL